MASSRKKEYSIVILGSTGVGKSSLCLQFCRNRFPDSYQPTIEDYFRKPIILKGHNIHLDILDTAGQEVMFQSSLAFITQSQGFILVYDITRKQSFEELVDYRDRILVAKEANWIPMVIVANKCDLESKREVSHEEGRDRAYLWNCQYFEVSAKDKLNHELPFIECANAIFKQEANKNIVSDRKCCNLM